MLTGPPLPLISLLRIELGAYRIESELGCGGIGTMYLAPEEYRGAPTIERDFRRLKGKPLGIRPLYVQRDDHAKGMVRLLSLALRVLTLIEHVVRQKLEQAGASLTGLYAGLPKRETTRPTTERLLRAFKEITLTVVHTRGQRIRHITPLNALQ